MALRQEKSAVDIYRYTNVRAADEAAFFYGPPSGEAQYCGLSMKFLHSADWQLGARFIQFGEAASRLREARLTTLKRALAVGRERHADAFLIAGDLFDDNQVDRKVAEAAFELFEEAAPLRIVILPGNHDPHTGPNSVWDRPPFDAPPRHVFIFREPGILELEACCGRIAGSPLRQKVSSIDPSLKLVELVRSAGEDRPLIGMTHGALRIPGKFQENDFPIALNAATRAGLDYLAVGHWHRPQSADEGRLVMPGTPEPDDFAQSDAGCVLWVEIAARHAKPVVERIPVATLRWREIVVDCLDPESARNELANRLAEAAQDAGSTVLRVRLRGSLSPAALADLKQQYESAAQPFLAAGLVDETQAALTEAELRQLQAEHPLLADVFVDLERLEELVLGKTSGAGLAPSRAAITLADAQALAAEARINLAELDALHFNTARQLLAQKIQEARS